jgi:hypothetical protein
MLQLIHNFWETATNVCRAKGNYGHYFQAGRGVIQGGLLLAKLFNIIVNIMVHEWMRLMRETLDNSEGDLAIQVKVLFAIFHVNDGYIASRDAEFLQESGGPQHPSQDIQAHWPCHKQEEDAGDGVYAREDQGPTPNGFIQTPEGGVAAREESKRAVVCHVCKKNLQRSLVSHLESSHDIYLMILA